MEGEKTGRPRATWTDNIKAWMVPSATFPGELAQHDAERQPDKLDYRNLAVSVGYIIALN